ncbi:MAG TPA: M20/M25/M40 family metallo-hydrolase [Allosphingosinicella sp.]|uniref:M20/M25/M40 family metallo-hydrolase n=1 Tax=Allosphingosinicella sp. TaxID=2823234 RepID=UPI002ED83C42
MLRLIIALLLFAGAPAFARPEAWVEANKASILDEYLALLAIPNVASDLPNIRRNADHIRKMMEARGLSPRLLESEDGKAPPLIYGEWPVPGAKRTLILYAHYDGQPVTSAQWKVTPPFKPVLLSNRHDQGGAPVSAPASGREIGSDFRVYARSASDDKAGVMAILAAVDALKAEKRRPGFNLKIVFEGEEEAGSPNLQALLRRHKAVLASDGWLIIDGPAHQTGPQQLVLGVRGDVNAEVTVYGPVRPLHSGHYGNWAPNPGMMLSELLASMKDETGRVTIAGFYDDVVPLSDAERAAIAAIPAPDEALKRELGLGWVEGGGASLTEAIQLPSLNINGIRSADVGENSRNVVPTTATAALDLRLVLGNRPDRQVEKVRQHIRAQGYEVLDREPTMEERLRFPKIAKFTSEPGYPAERTRLEHPLVRDLSEVLRRNGKLVVQPSLGGSLPLYLIREELGAPTIVLGLWNHDNNQHGEDENIRLQSLWDGIDSIAAVLAMP